MGEVDTRNLGEKCECTVLSLFREEHRETSGLGEPRH